MAPCFAVDPEKIYLYVPKDARSLPEVQRPIFKLKVLTAREAARIQDKSVSADLPDKDGVRGTMHMFSGSTTLKILEEGLVGWENLKFPDGREVPWRENNGKPRPENFDCLQDKLRAELADVISTGNFMSEEREKNSD